MDELQAIQGRASAIHLWRREPYAEPGDYTQLSDYAAQAAEDRRALLALIREHGLDLVPQLLFMLRDVCEAAVRYDAAIQRIASDDATPAWDPDRPVTVQGDELDALYEAWIGKARAALAALEGRK